MNLAQQVYQAVKPLPQEKVQEVLDFALFLQQRAEQMESFTAPYSSEKMVKRLRERKTNEMTKINAAKKGHTPITQKFIGLLADSHLDESDYKKHLEEKYL